ncbi:MAG: hypothetical protein NC905_06570 [Candidatus Omnitrophica bacterium]|nr:hypothetical protein [Candidatus Omnitrophota bacterium]
MRKRYSIKVKERFEIMNLLSSGVITERQVAKKLNLSIRQIQRLKKDSFLKVKQLNLYFFIGFIVK